MIILFDDVFLKFRIFLISIFLRKNNRIVKALQELKKNGVAVISNFYTEIETEDLKSECLKLLENVPLEKISTPEYISAEPIRIQNSVIYLEKLGKSIKLKGLNTINSFFAKIGKSLENNLITMVYHLNTSKPYLVYNVTHDGSAKHPILKDYSKKTTEEAIAGRPHVDLHLHQLRCFIALNDVSENNGATVYFNKSMNSNILKTNHINLFLKKFDFQIDNEASHYISENKLNHLNEKCDKFFLKCKKGDLALIDLKTAHYAVLPKKGERQLLWFYY